MTLKERVAQAKENDNSIAIKPEELGQHAGFKLAHMQYLGLRKSDLKKLERKGLARRGYVKVTRGDLYKGTEYQTRWVLIAKA